MNRTVNREAAVLVRREHVDDLIALSESFQNFGMIDDPHWMVVDGIEGWPAG